MGFQPVFANHRRNALSGKNLSSSHGASAPRRRHRDLGEVTRASRPVLTGNSLE